jgi:hypothetical protein
LAYKAFSGSGLNVGFRSYRAHLTRFVTTGHSRSKNGVALLAYAPVVHAEVRRIQQASLLHGLPDQVRQ